MKQSTGKSIIESIIVTSVGTVIGFILSFVIFPIFGIHTDAATIGGITMAFMIIGLIKNFLIRRFFNWLHYNPTLFWNPNQNRYQSLLESGIQTIIGTITSFWLSVWLYPYFGIDVPMLNIGGITLTFMLVSIIKNYIVRRYFENFKLKQ